MAQRKRSVSAQRQMTVFGVFDDHNLADQAVSELCKAGFAEKHIAVATRRDQACINDRVVEQAFGRSVCALTGREDIDTICSVADVGERLPVFERGVIAGSIVGGSSVRRSISAVSGSPGGAFHAAGVPEREALYYHNEWEAGRTVVTVSSGERSREAVAILRRHGSYDMLSGIYSRASG
jgi:hypothetical protein